MKALVILLVCTFSCAVSQAQKYTTSKKVYYTPIRNKIYFALDLGPVKGKKISGKDNKAIDNTVLQVDPECPIYKPGEDYKTGDMLRVLVKGGIDENVYTYLKIIGKVDDAVMNRIDEKIKSKAEEAFGSGKLTEWPAEMIEKKSFGRSAPNEKDIDCDYYILSSLENISPELTKLPGFNFPPTQITSGDASDLIVFYAAMPVTKPENIMELTNLTGSFAKIEINFKEKPGKSGKKIGKQTSMDLTRAAGDNNTYELQVDPSGDFGDNVNAWIQMDKKSAELVSANQVAFENKVLDCIDKAFGKMQ